jgi:hypothetical protein
MLKTYKRVSNNLYKYIMKKLDFNEFETREEAVKMLDKVYYEFGGCIICDDRTDEEWAVSNCNGFETVAIETFNDCETFFLNSTNIYYCRGKEIMAFIRENKNNLELEK